VLDYPPSTSPHFRAVRLLGCPKCRWADPCLLPTGRAFCDGPFALSIHPHSGRCLSARPIPTRRPHARHPTSPGLRLVELFNAPDPPSTLS
jgi:hypothetical protein